MLRKFLEKISGSKQPQKLATAVTPMAEEDLPEKLDIYDVFSVSTIASKAYIDRSRVPQIRNLKRALEQPGKIVGLHGPSKSGKTTFVRKVLTESKAGFVIISGQQILSVDGYWRQVSERLKLALEKAIAVEQGQNEQVSGELAVRAEFSAKVLGAAAEAKLSALSQKIMLTRTETEPVSSIRSRCLEFLEATKTAIVLDDFHEIKDPNVRKAIIRDIKPEAGGETGKFIFISIPKDAFLFSEGDEQVRNRFSFYEFPLWNEDELRSIARGGFDMLGIQYTSKQIVYIEKSSFGNPLNVQQICINVCTNLRDHFKTSTAKQALPADAITTALEDFATEHKEFLSIIDEAEKNGKAQDREKTYKYEGVELNIYQMAFAAISTMGSGGGGENGLLTKNITKRIAEQSGTKISLERVERVLRALANVEFKVEFSNLGPNELGSRKPFVYSSSESKIYVTNPIFRMFLLWGYRPSIGLENPVRVALMATKE